MLNEHFSKLIFFMYFVLKNWEGVDELLLKNGTIDGCVYQLCYFLAEFTLRAPWHFVDYRIIFVPKIGEDQKKFYHLSAGPLLALPYMVNLVLVIALRS